MWYKIKPLDTLFFRDGRPFSMGSETWANPVFPPYPSTVYGAIRTWLIFEKGSLKEFKKGEYKKELGTPTEKGSLKIKGPFISIQSTLHFPIPKDLLKKKTSSEEEKTHLFSISLFQKPEILISDYALENVLVNKTDFELDEAEGFLEINELIDYLKGETNILRFTEKNKIFEREPKIGIKRNRKTFSSEEGHLYKVPMIRFQKEVSFFVEIEGLNIYPEGGTIQLGADWKTAIIKKMKDDFFKDLRDLKFQFKNKIFKIYLATPAIFNNDRNDRLQKGNEKNNFVKGWLPKWIDKNTFIGTYNGIKVKLICCAIGKYLSIGGWDLANSRPKPMYKLIPAGSVYYFKILDDTPAEKIKETFHLKNISDINPEEGFGLSFIGEVKE
jgi:CRISPR-associated protein Cmr3